MPISTLIATVHKIETTSSLGVAVAAYAKVGNDGKITLSKSVNGGANGYQFESSDPDIVDAVADILHMAVQIAKGGLKYS